MRPTVHPRHLFRYPTTTTFPQKFLHHHAFPLSIRPTSLFSTATIDPDPYANQSAPKQSPRRTLSNLDRDINQAYERLWKAPNSAENDEILSQGDKFQAETIPGFKHLYAVRLIHPITKQEISIVGVRPSSIEDQPEMMNEISLLLRDISPTNLIVQYCSDRYAAQSELDVLNSDIPMNVRGVFDVEHLRNSARLAIHMVSMLTSYKRVSPFYHAVTVAKENPKIDKIILADVPVKTWEAKSEQENFAAKSMEYLMNSTRQERKRLGSYPGVQSLLLGVTTIPNLYDWIMKNKSFVRKQERIVTKYGFVVNDRTGFVVNMTEDSAKSLAHSLFNASSKDHATKDCSVMCLCTHLTMLALPKYFGNTKAEEIRTLRKPPSKTEQKKSLLRTSLFTPISLVCGFVCSIHTISHGVDPSFLMIWGGLIPLSLPTLWMMCCLRARRRLIKMQSLMRVKAKETKESQSVTGKIEKVYSD